jgi:hypothetical protein
MQNPKYHQADASLENPSINLLLGGTTSRAAI